MEGRSVAADPFEIPYCLATVVLVVATAQGATLFVYADAPGPADGQTWATAYTSPQDVLAVAKANDTIRADFLGNSIEKKA